MKMPYSTNIQAILSHIQQILHDVLIILGGFDISNPPEIIKNNYF